MDKGKIVALEDRIPKLKEQRKRKANRRLIFLLFLFFTMIAIIAYVQSPLSHVRQVAVKGNEMYSEAEIVRATGITNQTNIWKVNKQDLALKLEHLYEINKADIQLKWPNTILIMVQERKRIAFLEQDGQWYPVMEDGKILKNRKMEELPVNFPILINFQEGAALQQMVSELNKLPNEILNSISEIHYSPDKTDQYHITLFMNDGFEVSATMKTFSGKMVHYPSIISQLDPTKKGIIDLEVGSFFKAFDAGTAGNK